MLGRYSRPLQVLLGGKKKFNRDFNLSIDRKIFKRIITFGMFSSIRTAASRINTVCENIKHLKHDAMRRTLVDREAID